MSRHTKFHVFSTFFCYEMVPNKLENCAQCCFNKFDCRLFLSKFIEIAFYLSLSLSVISKSLAQPWCKCCNLSVSIALNMCFTTNGMCMTNNTHVARTSRNKMITAWNLHCCLVQQCKGVRKGRGLVLKPPFSLIFYEKFITCAKEINCFCILFAC